MAYELQTFHFNRVSAFLVTAPQGIFSLDLSELQRSDSQGVLIIPYLSVP
jgi:hypothetical protein